MRTTASRYLTDLPEPDMFTPSLPSRSRAGLLACGALAALTLLGPPQIAVRAAAAGAAGVPEGAALVVDARHHTDHGQLAVTARAEGLRGGKRVTQPIALVKTGAGSFVVKRQWETGSPWVLVFTAEQAEHGNHGIAEALVRIDGRGTIVGIDHPRAAIVATGSAPRVGEKEVSAALAALAGRQAARR